VEHKDKDILYQRVLDPIRDIIRTEAFYERGAGKRGWDTHVWAYPKNYQEALFGMFTNYLQSAYQAGLINDKSFKTISKNFMENYGVDYGT